jgi:hypothetical protein
VPNDLLRKLPQEFAGLAGPNRLDETGYRSERLQLLWNDSDHTWVDHGQHWHTESDEIFIVLKGSIEVGVGEEHITIGAGEMCVFPTGVAHAMTIAFSNGSLLRGLVESDARVVERLDASLQSGSTIDVRINASVGIATTLHGIPGLTCRIAPLDRAELRAFPSR